MPFDGNGNWTSTFFPIDDRDNAIPISATKFQTLIQDNLKQSFQKCMTIDSQTKPTANVDINNFKVVNVSDPTLPKDATNKQYVDAKDTLTEGNLWIGDDTNTKSEISKTDLATSFGVYISKPINDTIEYVNATSISWYGKALSSNDLFVLETDSLNKVTITLPVGATANTTYYSFVGYDNDTDKNLIGEMDTNIDGSGLVNITGSKRFVFSRKTDGSSEITSFKVYKSGNIIDVMRVNGSITVFNGSGDKVNLVLNSNAPNNALASITSLGASRGFAQLSNADGVISTSITTEGVATEPVGNQTDVYLTNGQYILNASGAPTTLRVIDFGYKIER